MNPILKIVDDRVLLNDRDTILYGKWDVMITFIRYVFLGNITFFLL